MFKNKKVLGLDIGTSSIKLVELDVSRRGAQLRSFGFLPTPPNCISGGEITDPQALSQVVRSLVSDSGTKRSRVATGMWGTSIIVKKVSMPKMDDKLLAEQIKWEAEQYIPFDMNEVNLEYFKLENSSAAPEMVDLLLIAAKSNLIFQYVEVVQLSGLECAVLDLSGFALANCFEFNYGRNPGQIALLNIGASVSNFVVLESGQPAFTRDIPVGGMTINNDIQNEMGVSAEEAESLKVSASLNQQVPDDVHRIMASTLETIAQEVHNSFDFYKATSALPAITKFYASGGCLAIPNIISRISQTVGVPGEELNPLKRVTYNAKKFSPSFIEQIKPFAAVAIGLGLRKEGD